MASDLLTIFFTLAIMQNLVLYQFLGLCPFFGVTKNLSSAFSMGLALIFVMTGASTTAWLITHYILIPQNIIYMNNVVYILVIASLVQIVELFIKRTNASLYNAFGVYLPLITTNCAVLGICFINLRQDHTFIESIVAAVGGAIGYMIVLSIMAGIREKLDIADTPISLKGLPQAAFVATMLGLAFMGFAGMV